MSTLFLCRTEDDKFGDQLLKILLDRNAVGALSWNGTGNKIARLKNLPTGVRCAIVSEKKIYGIGMLSASAPIQFLKKFNIVKDWGQGNEGTGMAVIVCTRRLDFFHPFNEPIPVDPAILISESLIFQALEDTGDKIWASLRDTALLEVRAGLAKV